MSMSPRFPISGCPPSTISRRWVGVAVLAIWMGCAPSSVTARGHDLFSAYIQHQVRLVVGSRHVDVTLELTFFEDPSERERGLLDADRDGRIRRPEIEAYLKALEPKLKDTVGLEVDGRPVAIASLYSPELDLLGNDRVGRGHHRLVLFFFAPTPDGLKPGAELVVKDRLWPDIRALGNLEVEGREGCRLEAHSRGDPAFPPAREGEAREFKARCLEPPSHK